MTQFTDQLSDKFGLNRSDIESIIVGLKQESLLSEKSAFVDLTTDSASQGNDKLDYIELFLAVSLNAKIKGTTEDARYKKLKLMLNNNSSKAVNLANLWIDGKLSFEAMLATI